ncbi:hypothetical protein M422DRAFT_39833 [Sphaerobolus stellatus SS14]|uniref:3-carboxymuconate cyclase n=1 Tax=Sphaerobolus stellatus (strain SS14) TaxID=990650 RepID=A0A0C9UD76_SPHS4|nr:hypothetical protein M422DRAFT_39833 [Sphaerobolus stellatus SS14]
MKFIALIGVTTLPGLASASFPWNLSPFNSGAANQFAGAAYFLSNEPDGNYIISSAINHNGTVTLGQAVWAGGIGARGTNDPNPAPDPLFSQGVITVSGKNVFTVNPGSNTVAMFSIDGNDPTQLTMVGQPANSGGEFPVSVAASQKTGLICVLNGGVVNGVSCFKHSGAKGLVQVPDTQRLFNLTQTTPPSGPPNTVSQVIFNQAETQLIASVKGIPPQPGFLAVWDINAQTGALSQNFVSVPPATGGALPFSLTPLPGQNALLATDPSTGYSIFDFAPSSNIKKNRSGTYPVQGQKATCWSAFSTKTGNAYIIDSGAQTISEISINAASLAPTIVNHYVLANGSAPIDSEVATVGGKDFLYVLSANRQSIYVMALDAPGKARIFQEMPFSNSVTKSGLTTDPFHLQGLATYIVS